MTISTSCPGCKSKYTVADSMAGKKAKCKKCGAILAIPKADDPVLAETSEPVLADLAGSSPLDGLTDRDLGGDPLGPSPLSPGRKPAGPAARRPTPSSGGGGVPKIVWIACGAGGGVCLLLLVLILVFGGSSNESAPPVAGDGATATSETPDAAAPSAEAPAAARKTTVAATVNDSRSWQWQPERLPAGPSGLLAQPLRVADRLQAAYFTRPDVAQAMLVFHRSSGKSDVLVQRLDLKNGQVAGEHVFPQYTKPLAASLDGVGLLLYAADAYAAQESLQLWRWKNAGLEQAAQWKPYGDQSPKRIAWTLLLDADRVLTYRASDPAAIAWDAAKGTEIYRVAHNSPNPLLLSPGGKYLVQHSGLWLRFFHAADGRHVGSLGPLSADFSSLTAIAFSPDGKSIAALFNAPIGMEDTLAVFDAQDGKLVHAIETPRYSPSVQWVSEDYLLAGQYLVSLKRAMTVWKYHGLPALVQSFDSRAWFAAQTGSEHYLTAAAVPSQDVESKIDAFVAANQPVLKAGDAVGLEVSVTGQSAPADLQQRLTDAFRGKLSATGYQIAEGGAFRLRVAVTEKDLGQPLEYRSFGSGGGTLQVPNRRVACQVGFVDSGGKAIWETTTEYGPAFMSFNAKGGDLVKELLDARWRNLDSWVVGLRIAKGFRRFSSTGQFGTSLLQAAGEQILSVPTP